jgi:hypothetical protein
LETKNISGDKMNTLSFPFVLTKELEKLTESYPDPSVLKNSFIKATNNERFGIIRLWVTEGIPFAFKNDPLLYEEIRSFIARGISVNTKEITLVGSARIGYSLKKKVWGKKFHDRSDLDFTVVSNDLFSKLVKDYQNWVNDFRTGKTIPKSKFQTKIWLNAIENVNKNIPNGYINTNNLFVNNKYPAIKKCNITMKNLQERLSKTPKCPKVSSTSIRVYSNWESCINQLRNNFNIALIW